MPRIRFSYNAHGSMASMPHLSAMDWDFADKLCQSIAERCGMDAMLPGAL